MATARRVRRGDVWWVSWDPSRGVEQNDARPAMVIQADFINDENMGSVTVLAMSTGSHGDEALHITVEPSRLNGLSKAGVIMCEQVMTISTSRLESQIGILEPRYVEKAEQALRMILGLR